MGRPIPLARRGLDRLPAMVKKSRGATTRRSASRAISLARSRARSVSRLRPKLAGARRSAGTDAHDAGSGLLPETPPDTSRAGPPNSPGAASRFRSTPRCPHCSPLGGRQPQSHERSLPPHRQAKSERKVQIWKGSKSAKNALHFRCPGVMNQVLRTRASVSVDIKHPQFCRLCRSAPPSAWAGTR